MNPVFHFLDDEELVLNPGINPYGRPPREIAIHPPCHITAKIPFVQQHKRSARELTLRRQIVAPNLEFCVYTAWQAAQLDSKTMVVCEQTPR